MNSKIVKILNAIRILAICIGVLFLIIAIASTDEPVDFRIFSAVTGTLLCLAALFTIIRWSIFTVFFSLLSLTEMFTVVDEHGALDVAALILFLTSIAFAIYFWLKTINYLKLKFPKKLLQRKRHNAGNAQNSTTISAKASPDLRTYQQKQDATVISTSSAGDGYIVTPDEDLIITSESALADFLNNYSLIGERRTKVVGVTYRNDDGSNRQSILAHCHAGDEILLRFYEYHGTPAYAVHTEHGQIGNLSADLAEELGHYGDDAYVSGRILSVTGGYHGQHFGCNIALTIYVPASNNESCVTADCSDPDSGNEDVRDQPEDPAKNIAHSEDYPDSTLHPLPGSITQSASEESKVETTGLPASPAAQPQGIAASDTVAEDSLEHNTIEDESCTSANNDSSVPNEPSSQCMTDTHTAEKDDLSGGQAPDIFDSIRDPEVMAHYIVLDIETTGFSRENDRIIEIAAIHYVFGEEAKRFHTYINPQMQVPNHITRLTGIRQADVDNAPLIDDVSDDFREFIKDYPLVGHNIIEFDLPFLEAHMDLGEPHLVIDTLDMSRSAFPLLPSHKLSNLNLWFNLDSGAPHRADADAAATNALMWACLYPDKYASLYRKATQTGLPEVKSHHNSEPHKHTECISISDIKPRQNQRFPSGPLCGKKIVFTGELSIARKDAMQMAVDAGALLRTSVSSKTDILVVGKQDLSVVGSDGMSAKQEKAQEINTSGKGSIKIIDETEFISLISPVSESDIK